MEVPTEHCGRRIALVGAGAVGLYYGTRLALNGEDVSFLLRSDYEVVKRQGIRLESVAGDAHLEDVQAFRDPAEIGPVDLVIVAWKATSNDRLEAVITPLLAGHTQVLTLQNGLGNCERLAGIVGPERVLGGLCFVCLNRLSAGFVRHSYGGKLLIGEWRPMDGSPRAWEMAARFQSAGVPGKATDSLEAAQWRKLVWNVPFNGLAIAEGGVTTDVLLSRPEVEAEARALMGEVIAAAGAYGHAIDPGVIDFEIDRTRPIGAYRPSSMIDFVEGREVEYEAIWAEPLRRAKEAGVPMPHLEKLAERIRQRIGR